MPKHTIVYTDGSEDEYESDSWKTPDNGQLIFIDQVGVDKDGKPKWHTKRVVATGQWADFYPA